MMESTMGRAMAYSYPFTKGSISSYEIYSMQ